eukprot:2889305-Pyramimonas_sp.AAC.1
MGSWGRWGTPRTTIGGNILRDLLHETNTKSHASWFVTMLLCLAHLLADGDAASPKSRPAVAAKVSPLRAALKRVLMTLT